MTDNNEKLNHLVEKLELLLKRHEAFSEEINSLRIEINSLKTVEQVKPVVKTPEQHKQTIPPLVEEPSVKSDLEKFIGENLINKIGIVITVIGVAIGAKYSIENGLISPMTRIILGYLFGLGLLGIGYKLKSNYENYSSVLVSGAIAIMYFITFFAYSLYEIMPQILAFGLMVVFTIFTVIAAIKYNRQVIAHIGLVGAYAVPFLLSDGSGKIVILFSYISIINIGILAISVKKYWKPLYYSSFGLTWLIYFAWYMSKYQAIAHFSLSFIFLSLFFAIFYLTFLTYKLLQKEIFKIEDIILLIINSFIFYGIGYSILDNDNTANQYLGIFTIINAIVHFAVGLIIYRQKLADKNLFYLVAGLGLVFITMAIPVQLDGNWVTLLWVGEAALLFWIGRTKSVSYYEILSYPLMLMAFISINQDWVTTYLSYKPENPVTFIKPLLNVSFLSSVIFTLGFGFITVLNRNKKYSFPKGLQDELSSLICFLIPAIFLITLYSTFYLEISNYWKQLYSESIHSINSENIEHLQNIWNYDLIKFKNIWLINYSLLFLSVLAFINIKKIKDEILYYINFGLIAIFIIVFLTKGLYDLSELRESYLEKQFIQDFQSGVFNITIRYISFIFVAVALTLCYFGIRQEFIKSNLRIAFDFLLHTSVLWIASSELINWMDIAESTQSYKLGLTILWGTYSLFLIVFGIWKKNKPLRVGAIALFGITLLKLFFYDISHLDTVSKTIVFVTLGVFLLIISFLYNKFKTFISDEAEN
jgi:hypothetical protein